MKRIFQKFFFCLSFLSFCNSTFAQSDTNWNLVWSDEFDYNGLPDDTKWSFDTEGNNWDWGNNEEQNYTPADNKNAWVENGNLVIEARKENYYWYGDKQTRQYTSARLRTLGNGDWLYGKFEIRALLPAGRGMWPAIWMLPSENIYGDWPKSGELDIMENVGYDHNKIHFNIHCEKFNGANGNNIGQYVTTSIPSENWHTYTMEWNEDSITFFLDGQKTFQYLNPHEDYSKWPYDQKFHLLLNIAVGGNWGGQQGIDDSVFPQRMLVDYVRVYQKSNNTKTTNIITNNKPYLYYNKKNNFIELYNIQELGNIYIYTIEGIKISEIINCNKTEKISTSNFAKGIYILKVGNYSLTFIKE